VHVISAHSGHGLDELSPYLIAGNTAVLLGSSGVGKSTLINCLLQSETTRTQEVRAQDQTGRHTTTARALFETRGGALIIDTPGMRELQLWDAEAGLFTSFSEIEQLAAACRFSDCRHEGEPDCAVQSAIEGGELAVERLLSYRKLQREVAFEKSKAERAECHERRRERRSRSRLPRAMAKQRWAEE
jgi:ribosome biogenesis GTPase